MKTARQWLNQLEEPYRTKALNNMYEENGNHVADIQMNEQVDALIGSFSWDNSPEGFDYWYSVFQNIFNSK